MLKTFKLHTINLSHQIFHSDRKSSTTLSPPPKIPSPYNKRFKYNYKKGKHEVTSHKNIGTISLGNQAMQSKIDCAHRITQNYLQNPCQQPKANSKQQRNAVSPAYNCTNQFPRQSKSVAKPLQLHSQRQHHLAKKQPSRNKPKSEKDEKCGTYQQNYIPNESEGVKLFTEFYEGEADKSQKQQGSESHNNSHSLAKINEISEQIHLPFGLPKSKTNPKQKYVNSIIKSYNIKSIELANPLDHRKRLPSGSVSPVVPSYYIDLANQDNLKEIHFQDIERIQLQKLKYDHRRTYSHQHKRNRPQTSKVPSKLQDFDPLPWESDERHQEIFVKETSQIKD